MASVLRSQRRSEAKGPPPGPTPEDTKIASTHNIGLYYPWVHFRDENWLKLAALYWDKMGRIVPQGYAKQDSEAVKRLAGELGFIQDIPPGYDAYILGGLFLDFLRMHEKELRDRYSVRKRDTWVTDQVTPMSAPPEAEPRFGYIFDEKLAPELLRALIDTGLAAPHPRGDPRWVGMHPKLAYIYMTMLAEEIAGSNNFCPITHQAVFHVGVTGCTIERLSQVLLGSVTLAPPQPTPREAEFMLATVAVTSVIPEDIERIPMEKIVQLRTAHGEDLKRFQAYAANMIPDLLRRAGKVTSKEALQAHMEVEYQKELQPHLDSLRETFRSLGVATALSAMNVRVVIPPGLATIGEIFHVTANAPALLGLSLALSLVPVFRDKRLEAREARTASPAAYLFYAEENLAPGTVKSRVFRYLRRLTFGV